MLEAEIKALLGGVDAAMAAKVAALEAGLGVTLFERVGRGLQLTTTGHALLEHAREQMGKNFATQTGLRLGAALLGLGDVGDMAARMGSQLLSLTYSRTDETQADGLGLVMSAQAGYDPRAGITLWEKMMKASGGGSPPKLLSTHPASSDRIRDIEGRLPRVLPMFDAAAKPRERFGPPPVPKADAER